MGKLKKVNLNYYNITSNKDEADLIIIPKKIDGQEMPVIMFKSKRECTDIINVDDATWSDAITVSRDGTPVEYGHRVDWWFDNASSEYKQMVNSAFASYIDVPSELSQARGWLKQCNESQRKNSISRFLWKWMTRARYRSLRRNVHTQ